MFSFRKNHPLNGRSDLTPDPVTRTPILKRAMVISKKKSSEKSKFVKKFVKIFVKKKFIKKFFEKFFEKFVKKIAPKNLSNLKEHRVTNSLD